MLCILVMPYFIQPIYSLALIIIYMLLSRRYLCVLWALCLPYCLSSAPWIWEYKFAGPQASCSVKPSEDDRRIFSPTLVLLWNHRVKHQHFPSQLEKFHIIWLKKEKSHPPAKKNPERGNVHKSIIETY